MSNFSFVFFGLVDYKKKATLLINNNIAHFIMKKLAEREGFEPPDLLQSTVFKTAAFDRSAISPIQKYDCFLKLQKKFIKKGVFL